VKCTRAPLNDETICACQPAACLKVDHRARYAWRESVGSPPSIARGTEIGIRFMRSATCPARKQRRKRRSKPLPGPRAETDGCPTTSSRDLFRAGGGGIDDFWRVPPVSAIQRHDSGLPCRQCAVMERRGASRRAVKDPRLPISRCATAAPIAPSGRHPGATGGFRGTAGFVQQAGRLPQRPQGAFVRRGFCDDHYARHNAAGA